MAHHIILATVQVPVRASGCNVKNRYGQVIATATSTFMADAIVTLMNHGIPMAEAEEREYQDKEAKIRQIMLDRLT